MPEPAHRPYCPWLTFAVGILVLLAVAACGSDDSATYAMGDSVGVALSMEG